MTMTNADNPAGTAPRLDDYFTVLAPDDIRLAGSRIGIESILAHYVYHARMAEEIAALFPSLSLEDHPAHRRERERIGRYLATWLDWSTSERQRAARDPRWQALEQRLQEAYRQAGGELE
jgi:hypothetical protein